MLQCYERKQSKERGREFTLELNNEELQNLKRLFSLKDLLIGGKELNEHSYEGVVIFSSLFGYSPKLIEYLIVLIKNNSSPQMMANAFL